MDAGSKVRPPAGTTLPCSATAMRLSYYSRPATCTIARMLLFAGVLTMCRPETYRCIPAPGRPTPSQLFNPHPRVFDFLMAPVLRDLMCTAQDPDVRWLSEGAATIECGWPSQVEDALAINDITGELDFTMAARVRNTVRSSLCAGNLD